MSWRGGGGEVGARWGPGGRGEPSPENLPPLHSSVFVSENSREKLFMVKVVVASTTCENQHENL